MDARRPRPGRKPRWMRSGRPQYRKRPWWLPAWLGSNDLAIGAVFIPVMAAMKFVTDDGYSLEEFLKLVGVGVLLAGLCIGFHVLLKPAWRYLFNLERSRGPTRSS